jgi:hypothetical protein
MKAETLYEFRVAQLAVKGSLIQPINSLLLEGIDSVQLVYGNESILITEVSLNNDAIVIQINDTKATMSIKIFDDNVIQEVTDRMKNKALELALKDVMVNGKGELLDNQ